MKVFYRVALCMLMAAALSAFSGCKSSGTADGEGENGIGGLNGTNGDPLIPGNLGGPGEGVPRDPSEWTPIPGAQLPTVYFAYDQSTIGTSEFSKVQNASGYLKDHADHCLIIEGNCDDRGSLEYNRALGERRAIAVKDALLGLGVADNRMKTISYGEERPAVQGADENAWAKNRRAEMVPAK